MNTLNKLCKMDGASSINAGTTIKMIEAQLKEQLVKLKADFLETKMKLEAEIEDLEDALKEDVFGIFNDNRQELTRKKQKLEKELQRAVKNYQTKVELTKESAEAAIDRHLAEREDQITTVVPDSIDDDRKKTNVVDWLDSCSQKTGFFSDSKKEEWGYQAGNVNDKQFQYTENPATASGAVDKDTLLMQLMQTQLGFLQKSQGSYTDKRLPEFSGDPSDWGNFKATFQRTQRRFNFEDSENLSRLQAALKGKAREAVKHLMTNVGNVPKILQVLEQRFGRPEFILDFLMEKAKSCKKPDQSKPETIVDFGTAVEDLVTNICTYDELEYMYNKQLVVELVDKLPGPMKQLWYRWLTEDKTRKTNLINFSSWLSKETEIAILQIKPTITIEKTEEKSTARTKRNQGAVNSTDGFEEKSTDRTPEKKLCPVCGAKSHGMDDCWSLKKKSIDERWKIAREAKVCFCCLKEGHQTKSCQESKVCSKDGCGSYHHRLLHTSNSRTPPSSPKLERKVNVQPTVVENDAPPRPSTSSNANITISGGIVGVIEGIDGPLAIVPVRLKGPDGVRVTHALLDSGASRTLIKNSLADELGLNGPKLKYTYKTAGGKLLTCNNAKKVNLEVSGKYRNSKAYQLTDVVTVDEIGISPYTINVDTAKKKWPHLRRYKGPSLKNAVAEIIIGGDHGFLLMHRELLFTDPTQPVGVRTVLGWVLQGKLTKANLMGSGFHIGGVSLDETLHKLILESFQTEDYGVKDPLAKGLSIEDKKAMRMLKESTRQREDGRWETSLLWKSKEPFPSNGYREAFASLLRAEKKMAKDVSFSIVYKEKIQEYLDKGYLRKLPKEEAEHSTPLTRYISHFGVVNPKRPGKFRLVFNAAEKSDGVSFNDRLMTGPDLLRPLPAVISNFRMYPVVLCADIEDMYHRIFVRKEDWSSQRLLWRDGNSDRHPDVYEMTVLIFGAAPSQASAIFAKNENAKKYLEEFPAAAKAILEDMYSDDLLSGGDSIEEAVALRHNISKIMSSGGMVIKKWISNQLEVTNSIPVELRLGGEKALTEKSLWNTERILGIWWDPQTDEFTFKLNFNKVSPDIMNGKRPTKRQMCSLLMSLFDPLGFLANYRIKGMVILQKVWNSEVDWDELIPKDLHLEWSSWLSEMNEITSIRIPRCYSLRMKSATVQLHCLVDASSEAYCGVCYFRIVTEDTVEVSFVAARVKVAPKKKLTIPRLELEAAVLGAKLAARILRDVKVAVEKCYFWSDSSTVLSWISSDSCRYKEYVANRVSLIQSLSSAEDWRWVSTNDYVADDATRSQKETDLSSNSRWLRGPEFLYHGENDWRKKSDEDMGNIAAVRGDNLVDAFGVGSSTDDGRGLKAGEEKMVDIGETIPKIEYFSSYFRLLRATAAVGKYWMARSRKEKDISSPWEKSEEGIKSRIPAKEVINAEKRLIKFVQQQSFSSMKINSRKFDLFKDQDGILRMRGRIGQATGVDCDTRNPILLPSQHPFVDLLADFEHRRNAHTGRNTVYNAIRQRFWIPGGRQVMRRSWTRCHYCKLQKAKPIMPEMGELPAFRLEVFTPPFSYTGVDMFGPMEVTVGRRHEKRWGMLFTDMVTRGIHLEITSGLSCDDTMMAFSRFVDCRGLPQHVFSDNGTNFQAVSKELVKRKKYYGSQWHFIPPASPHMGGAWESLVKQVKKVLFNLVRDVHPKDQVLLTAFKAVEGVVNSRPLTFVSGDDNDPESLTPNHFLRGIGIASRKVGDQAATSTSASFSEDVTENHLRWGKQWEKAQAMAQQFWERWSREVLPGLLRRNKWNQQRESLQVGDIVLMMDDQSPRRQWNKAVITRTFPGKDGSVRVVEVTTRNFETKTCSTYKRAVAKVCPIGLRVGDLDPVPEGRSPNQGAGNGEK